MCIITRMKLLQIPVPFLLGSHDVSTDKANESTKQGYSTIITEGGAKITKPATTNCKAKIAELA